MNWENRISTMVKESSAKIDEAKRRLNSSDQYPVKIAVGSYSAASYSRSTPGPNHRDFLSTPDSSSLALLHTLCEKTERQSQTVDLLKAKVETLEATISKQDKEIEHLKDDVKVLLHGAIFHATCLATLDLKHDQLSQVCGKVDQCEPLKDERTIEEWKSEIKNEINKINMKLQEDNLTSTMPKRNESVLLEKKEWIGKGLDGIKSRLDGIEMELSGYRRNTESNSKMVKKNISLLKDLKDSNQQYLERLTKLQDLSVDEINDVRTELSRVQNKVHELEGCVKDSLHKDCSRNNIKSKNIMNDTRPISENSNLSECHHISISSDEQDQNSSTDSSLHFNESDNNDISLQLDDLDLEQDPRSDNEGAKKSVSEPPDSSIDSLSGSEISLTDI